MNPDKPHRVQVIDSHTGGEPTRLVIAGGPDLGSGSMAARLKNFQTHHDRFRSAVVNEPRGSDVLVGALLCDPVDPTCAAGVIFFNNVGMLGMCGHGTLGLLVSLAHLGRLTPGSHRIETPAGVVQATLHDAHRVTVRNVASYRYRTQVTVDVPGYGPMTGDIAYGGNWFFLVADHRQTLTLNNLADLTHCAQAIRNALGRNNITGADGAEIDHIELFGPPSGPHADSRNFVLCPGGAYDRSPCGTGTSAKMACLAADGKLVPGTPWRQESILGSLFEGSIEMHGDQIIPTLTGTAHVTGEATLIMDPTDPLRDGIRVPS